MESKATKEDEDVTAKAERLLEACLSISTVLWAQNQNRPKYSTSWQLSDTVIGFLRILLLKSTYYVAFKFTMDIS